MPDRRDAIAYALTGWPFVLPGPMAGRSDERAVGRPGAEVLHVLYEWEPGGNAVDRRSVDDEAVATRGGRHEPIGDEGTLRRSSRATCPSKSGDQH